RLRTRPPLPPPRARRRSRARRGARAVAFPACRPTARDPLASPPRSAPASTSRARLRRGTRRERPRVICPRARPDRHPRTERRPPPPIRPDRRRARTRTCPTGRGGWCAKVSLPRPSGHGIEPRWLTERAQQRALLRLTPTRYTPHQEIAVFGDVA